MFHERTHTVFLATYDKEEYVISNYHVQEALAQFLAFHQSKEARIEGVTRFQRASVILDIKTRELHYFNVRFHINKLAGSHPERSPSYSLLLSNDLWEVENRLGSDYVESILKSFTDGLNRHRKSFDGLMNKPLWENGARNLRTIYEYEFRLFDTFHYFLAVLRLTALETGAETEIEDVTVSVLKSLGFSSKKAKSRSEVIKELADVLEQSPPP